MAMKSGNSGPVTVQKIDHIVFHPDEERELDARFAELSGTDAHLPSWTGTDTWVPVGGEQSAIVFGVFGSI